MKDIAIVTATAPAAQKHLPRRAAWRTYQAALRHHPRGVRVTLWGQRVLVSRRALDAIWSAYISHLSPRDLEIANHLQGVVWPGLGRVAQQAGVSLNTARRARAALRQFGLLTWRGGTGGRGGGEMNPCLTRVRYAALFEQEPPGEERFGLPDALLAAPTAAAIRWIKTQRKVLRRDARRARGRAERQADDARRHGTVKGPMVGPLRVPWWDPNYYSTSNLAIATIVSNQMELALTPPGDRPPPQIDAKQPNAVVRFQKILG